MQEKMGRGRKEGKGEGQEEEEKRKEQEKLGRSRNGQENAGKGGKDQEVLVPAQVPAAEAELPQLPFLLERGTAG